MVSAMQLLTVIIGVIQLITFIIKTIQRITCRLWPTEWNAVLNGQASDQLITADEQDHAQNDNTCIQLQAVTWMAQEMHTQCSQNIRPTS